MSTFIFFIVSFTSVTFSQSYQGPIPKPLTGFGADGSNAITSQTLQNPINTSQDIIVYYPQGTTTAVPTIFFAHGFSLTNPESYLGMFNFLVSKGYAVVFVPYPIITSGPITRYQILESGFLEAASQLSSIIDTQKVGFVGHSFGAGALFSISNNLFTNQNWGSQGKFLMPINQWYSLNITQEELHSFDEDTKLLVFVNENDDVTDHRMAIDMFRSINIPVTEKDYVFIKEDVVSGYAYASDHYTCLTNNAFDAIDYYSFYRLLDALIEYTFNNNTAAKDVALGGGSSLQTNMPGGLSDLEIDENPSPQFPESNYSGPCSSGLNPRTQFCGDDSTSPTVQTQAFIIQLDVNGEASITPLQIDNGSTDDVTAPINLQFSLDTTDFTCTDIGVNTVTLTVTDVSGNSDDATATITVEDVMVPTAVSQDLTVQLDVNGEVSITAAEVNNGSSDNCSGTLTFSLDNTDFTCTDIGNNTVTLTVTDVSGNSDDATATITVEDVMVPTAVSQDLTVQLDINGEVSITAAEVNNGSSDNCSGTLTFSLDNTDFTCTDIGNNTVTLTVTDAAGNSDDASAIITVEDGLAPIAISQDITVQLDANGEVSISGEQVNNGSSDNCSGTLTFSLDNTDFTCTDIGNNTVTLTVTDVSGNSDDATATITVEDTLPPTVIGQDITIDLMGNASVVIMPVDVDNGTFDNCTFSLSISQDVFTETGTYPVILSAIDGSNNGDSVGVVVTVIESVLSIEVDEYQNEIKVIPNPTSTFITIDSVQALNEVSIYNTNGLLVLKFNTATFDVSSLSSGVYFLKVIDSEGKIAFKKIIKE